VPGDKLGAACENVERWNTDGNYVVCDIERSTYRQCHDVSRGL
jgi:hypothetical protein